MRRLQIILVFCVLLVACLVFAQVETKEVLDLDTTKLGMCATGRSTVYPDCVDIQKDGESATSALKRVTYEELRTELEETCRKGDRNGRVAVPGKIISEKLTNSRCWSRTAHISCDLKLEVKCEVVFYRRSSETR